VLCGWDTNGTGSGSCSVVSFGFSDVELSGYIYKELDCKEIGYECRRQLELDHNHFQ
jgi:hypothetical protein